MRQFSYILSIVIVFSLLISCEKEHGPSVDDHFLAYEIPEIPVTEDYLVGVDYRYEVSSFGVNDRRKELFTSPPIVGEYANVTLKTSDGTPIVDQHLEWMNKADIDFVILTVRSGTTASSSYQKDITYIGSILRSPKLNNLKFAVAYDFGGLSLGSTAPSPSDSSMIIENKTGARDAYINDYVEFISPFFDEPNYLKIEGKNVVFLKNAYRLYSRNNETLTKKVREALGEKGKQIYLAGLQGSWTPPARYETRFKGAVDAIYHDNYANTGSSDMGRVLIFHQYVNEAWAYSKQMFNSWGIDYIPNISPSWNQNLGSSSQAADYYYPYLPKDAEWFSKYCNIAKMNSGGHRMVIVDSWNNWQYDAQIEPAEAYDELYLDILRQQFKR